MKLRSGFILLLLSLNLTTLGCGKKVDKFKVTGTVTWNGTPIKSGFITFKPSDGRFAPEAGPIEDGKFSFDARPGKNNVEIRASKEAGYNAAMKQPNYIQYIPAEHNSESKRTVEVSVTTENTYDIKLTGKES